MDKEGGDTMAFAGCPETMREAALWHAARGRPVFPCFFQTQPTGKIAKRPLTPHGFHDATLDAAQITKWWTDWPDAGIGMPCGAKSGLMAIDYDIDVATGVTVHEIREEFHERFDLPQTLLVESIRGGLHEYLQFVPDVARSIHAIHPAVDILGEGGYVVLPPSRMSDGRAYKVLFDTEPCEATESLLVAIREAQGQPNLRAIDGALGGDQYKEDLALWNDLDEPGKWHVSARTLVARYVHRGIPASAITAMAPAFRRMPFSLEQTIKEIGILARGADKKYGKAPGDLVIEPDKERDPFPLIPIADMGLRGPPAWRIQNIIPQKGFGVLYGPSGAFKSFIALDLALTIAYGLQWRGKATEQAAVAYIAGEGTYGIQNRVVAWREHRAQNQTHAPFWLAPVAANFLDAPTVKLIAERLQALEVKLVIVDTLARSFGGGDENSTQDMGRFVAACDYLRDTCDAFVLAIHHTGVSTQERARGSSALKAAADVELSVSRGTGEHAAVLHVTKMKDAEDGARVRVRMVPVDSVFEATGEIVTSLVPVIDEADAPLPNSYKLGRNERSVMDVLLSAYPLKFVQLKNQTGIENGTLGRTLRALLEKGLIDQNDDLYSPTRGGV